MEDSSHSPLGDAPASRLASREIYHGKIVHLFQEDVQFPDGSTGTLEVIRHPGAAAVLPVFGDPTQPDPEILLVRQYRYATNGYIYEVPAGLPSQPGEPWDQCAARELEEETGYRAGILRFLTTIYTTPGFTDEQIHLFLASDLHPGTQTHDVDEFMEIERMPLTLALERIRDGRIIDGKTLCTLLFASTFLLCR
jgi:ADP-ribose pyrophosphatase